MNHKIRIIFWDFDGVLINSNLVREIGFKKCLDSFPENQVAQLLEFHRINGGLSRYVKFKYFFENIRKESVSDIKITDLANCFSKIMIDKLCDTNLLIKETIDFIKFNTNNYIFHITSGSDQKELRFICDELKITKYFESIHGSPTPKNQLVKELICSNKYDREECVLIGDSINDFDAAIQNGVYFRAYNATKYIDTLTNLQFDLSI
jgi:phosphoglycolate phosphatase-like HAD superfamily hydrolase